MYIYIYIYIYICLQIVIYSIYIKNILVEIFQGLICLCFVVLQERDGEPGIRRTLRWQGGLRCRAAALLQKHLRTLELCMTSSTSGTHTHTNCIHVIDDDDVSFAGGETGLKLHDRGLFPLQREGPFKDGQRTVE